MSVEYTPRLLVVKVSKEQVFTYRTGFYQTKENTWMPFRFAGKNISGSWIEGRAEAGLLYRNLPESGNIIAFMCEKKADQWYCGFEKTDGRNASPWTFESYSINQDTSSKQNETDSSTSQRASGENEIIKKNESTSYEPNSCDTCSVIGASECAVNLRSSFIGTDFLGTHMRVCKLVDGCRKWVVQECSRRVCMNKQCR